tara:strand:+ start:242 stop:739 length:498 start_codon:yes stop_codon:yes gene_type:complete
MTFTAYSPRVARGGLTDDFSKFQATADKVRDDIKADAISRALKWQSLEARGKIKGAQPPQPSQPSMLESVLGAGANWLLKSENSPLDDWSSGLRGLFGGNKSNVLSGSEGAAWQAGAYSPELNYTSAFAYGGNVPDYGIDLTPALDFTIPSTNAFNLTGSGGSYF